MLRLFFSRSRAPSRRSSKSIAVAARFFARNRSADIFTRPERRSAAATPATNRLACRLAREIQTALLVEDSERGIDPKVEAMLANEDAAESMDRRYWSRGQHSDGLHPLTWLGIQRRANSVPHFRRGLF